MIPVEIRLKDFEAYIKDAKSFLKAIRILHISTFLLVVISALYASDIFFTGVVLILLTVYIALLYFTPNWIYVEASYKEAQTFYKSLLDSEPCSFVPMHIEGSYNRATLTYHFDFKPCSYSWLFVKNML